MIFYGIMLYVPNLAGDLYLNLFLMFLTDLPHTPMSWFAFKWYALLENQLPGKFFIFTQLSFV